MKKLISKFSGFILGFYEISSFVLLIIVYMFFSLLYWIRNSLTINRKKPFDTSAIYQYLRRVLDQSSNITISKTDLIELSLRNMAAKKTRTLVTMGGMSLGIGLIVFLVSLGYGVEQLIISRVAKLEELRQAEVSPGMSADMTLDDKTIAMFKQIPNISDVFPVISAVGEISFNNSSANIAVYGVTTKYLSESAIKTTYGRLYQNDDLATTVNSPVSTNENTDNNSKTTIIQDSGSLPIVKIASLSAQKAIQKTDIVTVGGTSKKEVVINRNTAKILNLAEPKAIGQKIKINFVVINNIGSDQESKIKSAETEYEIVGVVPDDSPPLVYVPFIDIKSLGAKSYSQIKITADNQDNLPKVRQSIESTGYPTSSVVDTVGQIDSLFKGIRTSLGVLGFVALSVAALGMFNTLTVSLMERTREVGLMKAIGMRSSEIRNLFLSESMLMGFFAGIAGLILGFIAGKLTSVVLSMLTITKGAGFVDVSHVPPLFAFSIFLLSLLIGLLTGVIPARRSTRISAIDAIRYE